MTIADKYNQNRPLFNSIMTGILYFLLFWSLDFGSASSGLLMILIILLPGITFPVTTCYFKSGNIKQTILKRFIHFALSFGIYQIIVFLFYIDFNSKEGIKHLPILAGLLGSLLFQLVTKYLLKKETTLTQIAITSVLSGLVFLPFALFGRHSILMGLAVFLWTIINGHLLNYEYKKHTLLKN